MAYGTVIRPGVSLEQLERDSHPRNPTGAHLYRVDAVRYSYTIDADNEEYGTTDPALELTAFEVLRWTPCGATLTLMSGARHKFVNFSHTKQFACRTAAEALESFYQRRLSQIRRLRNQLAEAERELKLVEAVRDKQSS